MSKRNKSRGFSKKKSFPNAKRITKTDGSRVWFFNGNEYLTLQDIVKEGETAKNKPLTK
jgi:hypothetical protein